MLLFLFLIGILHGAKSSQFALKLDVFEGVQSFFYLWKIDLFCNSV